MRIFKLRKILLTISVFCFLLHPCRCRCPGIFPCQCHGNGNQRRVDCQGSIGLPKLTHILQNTLCGHRLNKFTLTGSDITYLPSNLFHNVLVEHIEIVNTNVTHFTEAGYSAFYRQEHTLKSLSMRHCNLVDGLQWQKIGELEALDTLDLSANDLTTVPVQWFQNPPKNLMFLYLRGNKISSIHSGALANMHKLVLVDLSENYLHLLERDVFAYPANSITILKLSYNHLTSLEADVFDEMFGLRRIYLDNNALQNLDVSVWIPIWSEVQVLDVSGNDFKCECSMEWVSRLYPIERLYGSCDEDSVLPNRPLASLQPWDFNCTLNPTDV